MAINETEFGGGVYLAHDPGYGFYPTLSALTVSKNTATMSTEFEARLSSGVTIGGHLPSELVGGPNLELHKFYDPAVLSVFLNAVSFNSLCWIKIDPNALISFSDYVVLVGGYGNGQIRRMHQDGGKVYADAPMNSSANNLPTIGDSPKSYYSVYRAESVAIKKNGVGCISRVAVDVSVPQESVYFLFADILYEFPFARFMPVYVPFWNWKEVRPWGSV